MKLPHSIFAILLLCCGFLRGADTLPDTFLPQSDYEDCTLGDIYLSLPSQFFEITYRQRLEFLLRGIIRFDEDKKQIYIPGDGGQMRITASITEQTKEKLILAVTTEFEGEKNNCVLERIPNGWKMTEKH